MSSIRIVGICRCRVSKNPVVGYSSRTSPPLPPTAAGLSRLRIPCMFASSEQFVRMHCAKGVKDCSSAGLSRLRTRLRTPRARCWMTRRLEDRDPGRHSSAAPAAVPKRTRATRPTCAGWIAKVGRCQLAQATLSTRGSTPARSPVRVGPASLVWQRQGSTFDLRMLRCLDHKASSRRALPFSSPAESNLP
jgi:hypothetical protein